MTVENARKLYKHYLEVGYTEALNDILSKYPEFAEKPKPKAKPKVKE